MKKLFYILLLFPGSLFAQPDTVSYIQGVTTNKQIREGLNSVIIQSNAHSDSIFILRSEYQALRDTAETHLKRLNNQNLNPIYAQLIYEFNFNNSLVDNISNLTGTPSGKFEYYSLEDLPTHYLANFNTDTGSYVYLSYD